MVKMRQITDTAARFLKLPIFLPREIGPRMNAEVITAWTVL